VKHDFSTLEKEITISLHSRKQHQQARVINENPDMFDHVKWAWVCMDAGKQFLWMFAGWQVRV
jgi:DNA adenine methylase